MKGFFSPIERLLGQSTRGKGTGAEFMTELSKQPGYKQAEVEDRDLQTLMALPKMAREEFMAQLKAKPGVVPQERMSGKRASEAAQLRQADQLAQLYYSQSYDELSRAQQQEIQSAVQPNETHHEDYTLPGGENYREILLQHPKGDFPGVEAHFGGTPNILASIRVKDRTGPNGEKILHLEEIQSDWHQMGREKGYVTKENNAQLAAAYKHAKDAEFQHKQLKSDLDKSKEWSDTLSKRLESGHPDFAVGMPRRAETVNSLQVHNENIMDLMPQVMKADEIHRRAREERERLIKESYDKVSDAPFKKNWHELALKRMIQHAAENGYDSIAITPGEEQAKRYGLSKHVGMVSYNPDEQHFQAFKPNRETLINEKGASPERVSELIGKDAATRLMSAPAQMGHHFLEGEDLNIGGEGMKGFYDKMLPKFLNQFGKKYGAQVGKTDIPGDPSQRGEASEALGLAHVDFANMTPQEIAAFNQKLDTHSAKTLHSFPITPEMRQDVLKNGIPMYAKGGEVEVRPTVKDETIQRKVPEMEMAAKALQAGIIDRKEYDRIVNKHKPVKPYTFVPQPATDEDAERALMSNKKPQWRGAEQWPAGRKVGLRLDIPAYESHGVWVNSIHDEEGSGEDKYKTSYGPVSSVKNATFDAGPSKGIKVATGEQNKSPFARIVGELHHVNEDEAVEHMKEHLNHPDWAQVGMDPRRHGFFYDRKTMKPVTHSAHVIQIGPLVLAHKPTYGKRESYAEGGAVDPDSMAPRSRSRTSFADQPRGNQIIKETGGNWIGGATEEALKPLRQRTSNASDRDPAETLQEFDQVWTPEAIAQYGQTNPNHKLNANRIALQRKVALNNWIDRNLTNYVKKQMATKEDPVRKLAEQGITHLPQDALDRGQWLSEHMESVRRSEGYPGAGLAANDMGRGWENLADEAIQITAPSVANKEMMEANPWLAKLPPDQSVYRSRKRDTEALGFDHIVDILKQDLAEGRIRPEQLNKISMEQAVRRVHEHNEEQAKKMRETAIKATEGMPLVKQYDTGHKWIELAPEPIDNLRKKHVDYVRRDFPNLESTDPVKFEEYVKDSMHSSRAFDQQKLEAALKYEGDTMGHCVGGYTPDVLEGKSRIFSLRDSKGEPHVTIETEPLRGSQLGRYAADLPEGEDVIAMKNPPHRIVQIKGKQNSKPLAKYIPMVQDFVKSGNWSDVGDLQNTDLVAVHPESDLAKKIQAAGNVPPKHVTQEELTQLSRQHQPEGHKRGGSIKPVVRGIIKERVTVSPDKDVMQYELMGVKHFTKKAK